MHAQVVAGDDFCHRQYRQIADGTGLEGQVRYAMFGIGGRQAGDVDQIGDDG